MKRHLLELHDQYRTHLESHDDVAAALMVLADVLHEARSAPDSDGLTVAEAARFLAVNPQTIYDLCSSRRLKSHRIGSGRGTIRIKRRDLELYRRTNETQ